MKEQNQKNLMSGSRIAAVVALLVFGLATMVTAGFVGLPRAIDTVHIDVDPAVRIEANMEHHVFYVPNDMFPTNPVSPMPYYLLSLTDRITLDHSAAANFGRTTDFLHTVTQTETLRIFYAGATGTSVQPVMFEDSVQTTLSQGQMQGDQFVFAPAVSAVINPWRHMEQLGRFLATHRRHVHRSDAYATGGREFFAVIYLMLEYVVEVDDVRHSVSQGVRINLMHEVYSVEEIAAMAPPGAIDPIRRRTANTPIIAASILLIMLSIAASILAGVLFARGGSPQRRLVENILKKHAGSIVLSKGSIDVSAYTIYAVPEFNELLKLSINLNKHIMAEQNSEGANFYTIVDNYAYLWRVEYPAPRRRYSVDLDMEMPVDAGRG